MTPQVHIPNATSRGVIASLRAPCAQNVTLKRGYSQASPRQLGQVLVLPSTLEPVIATASGTVVSITSKINTAWDHAAGILDTHKTLEVKIDHGGYVSSVIHGLADVAIVTGQYVTRGDTIGTAKTTEIFLQLFYRNSPLDPATYSVFFRGYDGGKVPGKARKLRAGPDFIVRAVSDTVSYLLGGIRYFVDKYCTKPNLLINVDFNGEGAKSGFAVTGFTASDFWNSYTPVVFDTSSGYLCYSVLNPPTELIGESFDDAGGTVAFFNGTLFQVIFIEEGTEAVSAASTFLFGSTETIPEVDDVTTFTTFTSGSIVDISVIINDSDSGTHAMSFLSGSTFESVVYAFGSFAPQTPIVGEESAGTFVMSYFSGTLFESVVSVFGTDAPGVATPYVESAGTATVAFISGGTETLVFPVSDTNTTTGTVAFFSGSIHQF
jgi:hypothetical protein